MSIRPEVDGTSRLHEPRNRNSQTATLDVRCTFGCLNVGKMRICREDFPTSTRELTRGMPERSRKIAILLDQGSRAHEPEAKIATALRAHWENLTLQNRYLMRQAMTIVQHLVDSRFWGWIVGLEDLVRHNSPGMIDNVRIGRSTEQHTPHYAVWSPAAETRIVLRLILYYSRRLPKGPKARFRSSGFRPNCAASSAIFSSSFIRAKPISSTC